MSTDLMEAPATELATEMTMAQRLEHEHYEAIKAKAAEVSSARADWAAAKDKAKNKKGIFDELNAELIALIDGGPDMQLKLPLDGTPATDGKPAVDDAWRKVGIDHLDIKPGVVTKLAEHGIENLGQLQDYWLSGKDLTDLAGIGEAKAASVADAFSAYGVAHPEIFGKPAPVEAATDSEGSPALGVVSGDEDAPDEEDEEPVDDIEELVDDWNDEEDDDFDDEDDDDL